MSPRPLAVFDLDGTLADVRHRLHFLRRRPRDWDAFFRAAVADPPLAEGIALAPDSAADHEVVYLTGRPERCRRDTVEWLSRHGLPGGRLLMRPDGDRRPARVTKPELLRGLSRGRSVALVVSGAAGRSGVLGQTEAALGFFRVVLRHGSPLGSHRSGP